MNPSRGTGDIRNWANPQEPKFTGTANVIKTPKLQSETADKTTDFAEKTLVEALKGSYLGLELNLLLTEHRDSPAVKEFLAKAQEILSSEKT